MACPYFEPQAIAPAAQRTNARLPLIQEHQGLCRAGEQPMEAPPAMRFRYCNQGYSRGACQDFPSGETRSALRYDLVGRTEAELKIMIVEEQNYAPAEWRAVTYSIRSEGLDPEVQEPCVRAQVVAFCRSYLRCFCT